MEWIKTTKEQREGEIDKSKVYLCLSEKFKHNREYQQRTYCGYIVKETTHYIELPPEPK